MESNAASSPPKFGRVQARRLKTRARLLEAAYELMSTQGVDATTIKEITERADTGFGTFYRLIDQPWKIMSIGLRDWAYRF